MYALKLAVAKLHLDDEFTAPAANFWGLFAFRVRQYMQTRTNDFQHSKLTLQLSNMNNDLNTLGAACTMEQLELFKNDPSKVSHEWKGPSPLSLVSNVAYATVSQALQDLDKVHDLVLVELITLGEEYKQIALRIRSSFSQKSWRKFCLDHLSKGAGALHRFVNRQNSLSPAPLFRSGTNAKTLCQAFEVEQVAWQRFWQKDPKDWDAHLVLRKLRDCCRQGLSAHVGLDKFDMEMFSLSMLRGSAKNYRKNFKGSDHWLATELMLDDVVLEPIASAIDLCVVNLTWAPQMLCNLNPELLKATGGARTITKTPKLYRLWCRTRRPAIKAWENTISKPYDTCVHGMSALGAAAGRSLSCEIASRNGLKSCTSLFDLDKFFDTIEPAPLLESIVHTKFPPVGAAMAYQIHVAPRVILLSSLSSEMIRIDLSILAGCIYSIPFVKCLMHEGSLEICKVSKNHKTYVDDIANFASGRASDVCQVILSVALVFKEKLGVRRKFRLSPKSIIVSSELALAKRVAAELKDHGICVSVSSSHRDLGIMFTAGARRDLSLSEQRLAKAAKRSQRIARISKITRSARKLFTSGALPQAIWGHQMTGLAPSHLLILRRMAASTTGVSMHSQRCLISTMFVCFGRRRDPWQVVVKELFLLWVKLVPQFFQDSPHDLRLAWSRARQDVVAAGQVRWSRVTGLMANVIANLALLSWEPRTFSEWMSPEGDVWSIPLLLTIVFSPHLLIYALQDSCAAVLWKNALKHLNGSGREHGISFSHIMKQLFNYRHEHVFDRAAALETIMVGGCWPPHRRFIANMMSGHQAFMVQAPAAASMVLLLSSEGVGVGFLLVCLMLMATMSYSSVLRSIFLAPRKLSLEQNFMLF